MISACPPGYTGASCSTPCPSPSYGLRCQYLCQTCSTSSCHHVKGCPEFKCMYKKVTSQNYVQLCLTNLGDFMILYVNLKKHATQ